MDLLKNLSTAAGIVGIVICVISGALRITGTYHMGGIEMMTLFNIGVAGMVLGCLLKLEILSRS